ncbi:hypothetical protein CYMTET_46079 [Cymbomonas tetramitiformis]|uniref:Uncharacterized protein n=1 Tax=Cymbomonas tetramitiformis TaxID=36881 RepID=A0AAE0BWW3_9CHLO|nr:hypothetical protein CYMTET_46079 [Cymbomonas tetramitiformis]|eukprot:gene848-1334_t
MKRSSKSSATRVDEATPESKRDLLTKRTPTSTVVLAVLLFTGVFGAMYGLGILPDGYFHLYSSEVKFLDSYVIDEPYKAAIALSCTAFLTYYNVYVRRKLSAWQINYLNSPLVPREELDDRLKIQLTMSTFTIFLSLSSAVNIFFMFSNFWFLVAQTLATIIVTVRMTDRFLKEKSVRRSTLDDGDANKVLDV